MANEIKVTIAGEDEFSDVAETAFADARRAVDKFETSASGSAEKVGRDFDGAFDKLGEASGGAEQKFIGLSDSITGTQDVMEGLKTGNVATLAMGLADLAGAAEALWASFGKVAVQVGKKAAAMAADAATTIANTAATVAHTVATFAAEVASKAWAAAQWLLNAALTANPIGLVVVAIVALVAAFVLAWQHSETFRDIVTGAFNLVWGVIQAVWHWVSDNWPLLLAILTGPIGIAVGIIVTHWDTIKNGVTAVKDWIVEKFNDVVSFFTGLDDKIKSAVGDALGMLKGIGSDIMQGLWDGLKAKWDEVAGWVGGIGGKIKDLKGPIEKDRVLLQPEGLAIMEGLGQGLRDGWGGVASFLGGVAAKAAAAARTASYPVINNAADLLAVRASGRQVQEDMFAPGALAQGGYGGGRAVFADGTSGSITQLTMNVQALDTRSAEEGVARALEGARRRGLI